MLSRHGESWGKRGEEIYYLVYGMVINGLNVCV